LLKPQGTRCCVCLKGSPCCSKSCMHYGQGGDRARPLTNSEDSSTDREDRTYVQQAPHYVSQHRLIHTHTHTYTHTHTQTHTQTHEFSHSNTGAQFHRLLVSACRPIPRDAHRLCRVQRRTSDSGKEGCGCRCA